MTFPIGYHNLHQDASMNFQMTRWFGSVGEPDMLEEMRMVARVARKSPVMQWGGQHGIHVTGTSSAFEFLQRIKQFQTTDISASIRQDVLLMAGSEDHYVPVKQLQYQIGMLKNARQITARLFTPSESAQNHCQMGNYGLALKTSVDWLDGRLLENATVNDAAGKAVRYDEIRQVTAPHIVPTIFREVCHD